MSGLISPLTPSCRVSKRLGNDCFSEGESSISEIDTRKVEGGNLKESERNRERDVHVVGYNTVAGDAPRIISVRPRNTSACLFARPAENGLAHLAKVTPV